jgi:hypothetical protein
MGGDWLTFTLKESLGGKSRAAVEWVRPFAPVNYDNAKTNLG